jgi:hypothetical protein
VVVGTYSQDCGWQKGGGQEGQGGGYFVVARALVGDGFALERGESSVLLLMSAHVC